jgi:L-fucose isomerase-like protein
MSFTYIPVASTLHDARSLEAATGAIDRALRSLGGVPGTTPDPGSVPFWFVQTGGVEEEVLRQIAAWRAAGGAGPVLLAAHTGHNSLPASLEILARIRQDGSAGRIFLLHGADDAPALAALSRTATALEANRRLAAERIGQIGAPSSWLVASSHDAATVRNRFGATLVPVPLDEIRALAAREEAAPPSPAELASWNGATSREGVPESAFRRSLALYRGLKAAIADHGLSAITVRCFDWVRQDAATGCLALALLADEGISAGCEGDVPSILLLRWLHHLAGTPGWMANPSDIRPADGTIALAHCTVPLSLVRSYGFKTHFESGLGLGIDGTFPHGPVTLLRLGGARLERWWGAEGEITADTHAEGQCRTQVLVRTAPDALARLLDDPLGNHLVLAPGHILPLFAEAFSLLPR